MNVNRSIGPLKAVTVTALACCLAALPTLAQSADLETKTENQLGVSVSAYKYTEPNVTLKANKIGFDYQGTYAIGSEFPNRSEGWFVRGELRYATGKADYSSSTSGTKSAVPDWYYEIRGLVGKDLRFGDYILSPYAGLGYRYLFDDLRGTTSTGAQGYRRESNYYTLPVGVTHKMNLDNQAQLLTTLEYSYFIRGRQDSKLSDTNLGLQDVSNKQSSGYGMRLGTMVRFDTWSVGPFLSAWRVNESDKVGARLLFEPANRTYEIGVRGVYNF